MVDVVVVGTMAFDDIRTPFGMVNRVLGGSASYFSLASSFFCKPGVVSIVGSDFSKKEFSVFENKKIDLSGVEKASGLSFFWSGYYEFDLNQAHTVETQLNVLEKFNPVLPESFRSADFLFLGNISPELQLNVLSQMKKKPKLVVSDTMNFWIKQNPLKVKEVIKKVDIALMNESEARQLFETHKLYSAAKKILELDSKYAIIKKGEHGALMFTRDSSFFVPGFPIEKIVDPTGAGDSFAGGLMGYLAKEGKVNEATLRKAMVYGSAVASICVEDFSTNALQNASRKTIEKRVKEFKKMVEF